MAPPQIHRVGASGSVRDLVWLNQQLSRALGWDADMIEDVVETIACAANRAAVNDIVEVSNIVRFWFAIVHVQEQKTLHGMWE